MSEITTETTDNATDLTSDRSTVAGRIAAAGGAGLPPAILEITHQAEKRRQAIRTDPKINDVYRTQQLAQVDADEEQSLFDAQDREAAESARAFEQRKGVLIAQMKAQHAAGARDLTETSAEQLERHYRGTRDLVALQVEIETAKASADPDDLADGLDELLMAGRDDRIRRLGPVILDRLRTLEAEGTAQAAAALARARAGFQRWKQAHPTLVAQIRQLDHEQQIANQDRARAFATARDVFKVGFAKHGIRLP